MDRRNLVLQEQVTCDLEERIGIELFLAARNMQIGVFSISREKLLQVFLGQNPQNLARASVS